MRWHPGAFFVPVDAACVGPLGGREAAEAMQLIKEAVQLGRERFDHGGQHAVVLDERAVMHGLAPLAALEPLLRFGHVALSAKLPAPAALQSSLHEGAQRLLLLFVQRSRPQGESGHRLLVHGVITHLHLRPGVIFRGRRCFVSGASVAASALPATASDMPATYEGGFGVVGMGGIRRKA